MANIDITQELHQNFLDYSYETNSQRAFPDARDGLKPGQRACLWEMYDKKYKSNKPHVKSAKISGGVVANWWPHGDVAIYETFGRMSQSWINNCPEVDWHGANGSQIISGELAAARYTEARLSKFAEDGLFANIDKHNVKMIPNFSQDAEWPEVLPAIVPRLLINGSMGIGVTISQTFLPHNPKDVIDLVDKYITTGELNFDNLKPDFPTGGIIINAQEEISKIYKTGKGKVIVRAKTEIKGDTIIITEFPYQVYIEPWLDEVKTLIQNDTITGIDDIRNMSGKHGIRVEVICDGDPQRVLNQLFKETDLQKSYSANQFALVGKTPKLLNLKEYLDIFIDHTKSCIINEYSFRKEEAEKRLHIVLGLLKVLEDIDKAISIIKSSENADKAKEKLKEAFDIDDVQAKAVLAMRLSTLAKLEINNLNFEKKELEDTIKEATNIIETPSLQVKIYKERLDDYSSKYLGNIKRKSDYQYIEIIKEEKEAKEIIPEDIIVVSTKDGDIKAVAKNSYRGKNEETISTTTLDKLIIFTDAGKAYTLPANTVPITTSASRGVHLSTLVKMDKKEKVLLVSSTDAHKENFVVFFTKNGLIKKSNIEEYTTSKRTTGIQAIKLKDGDEIANIVAMNEEDIIILTKNGMGIHFTDTKTINPIGRVASGVKGIKLDDGDEVFTGLKVQKGKSIVINDKTLTDFALPIQKRGGKGSKVSNTEIKKVVIK